MAAGEDATADTGKPPEKAVVEPLDRAEACKREGNSLLAKGDFADACKCYDDGLLALVGPTSADDEKVSEVRLALHLNASLAHLRRSNLASAVEHASGALAIDSKSVKALYRRGVARVRLSEHLGNDKDLKLARQDLERALELDPSNADVRAQLKSLRASVRAEERELNKNQRAGFQAIFSGDKRIYEEQAAVPEPAPVIRSTNDNDHNVVLSADHVAFHYERGVPVLEEVNMELRAGRCVGLFGNNATGKTTLLRLLDGRLSPSSGRVVHNCDDQPPAPSRAMHAFGIVGSVVMVAAVAVPNILGLKRTTQLQASMDWYHYAGLAACLLVVWVLVKLALERRKKSSGARSTIRFVTSESSDKEDIKGRWTIEAVIGEHLPARLSSSERRELVIKMLEAGGFQMYNQETGEAIGCPREYVRDSLNYGSLSGGQKHLIYILRNFAARPAVLLCDELLGGLDAFRQPRVLHMLRRMQKEVGCAVLYVSCELHQQRLVADALAFIHNGKIVEYGPAEEVLDFPKHPSTREYVTTYRGLPGGHVIGGKLAEAFTGVTDDKALRASWLPPEK